MMPVTKSSIRERVLAIRDGLSPKKVATESRPICDHLQDIIISHNPKSVLLYSPIRNEVDPTYILPWLRKQGITVCLPSIKNETIVPLVYHADEPLSAGSFGVLQPSGKVVFTKSCDVIVVPCVAVDRSGYRIGYGKGYYDRFLGNYPTRVGLIYAFQMVDSLPHESHDKQLTSIISPTGECLR